MGSLFKLKTAREFLEETYIPLNIIYGLVCLYNKEQDGYLCKVTFDPITNTTRFDIDKNLSQALIFSPKAALVAMGTYNKLNWQFSIVPISALDYQKKETYDGSLN